MENTSTVMKGKLKRRVGIIDIVPDKRIIHETIIHESLCWWAEWQNSDFDKELKNVYSEYNTDKCNTAFSYIYEVLSYKMCPAGSV